MDGISRRDVILGSAGLAACLASPAAAAPGVPLPEGPMLLSREIRRELSDGKAIVVRRSWLVRFVPNGRGIAVEGKQASASVDAPEKLRPLAELEEQRDTNGMFPILLSADGRIVGAGSGQDADDIAKAVRIAEGLIAKSNRTPTQKSEAVQYLGAIQAAGGSLLETLPPDLFYPSGREMRQHRDIALPDGATGEIELVYASSSLAGESWLERASRDIVTRLGNSERVSSEIWRMVPVESSGNTGNGT